MSAAVLVEHTGALATLTLNRPERRNGVTVEMCAQVYDAVRAIATSEARVLIVRGAGEDFCVGADITGESGGAPPTAEDLGDMHQASAVLHSMPQVTIAVIDGGCAGAGLGWAAACDLRWASTRARFSTAFLNVGVSGDMGAAWSLDRLLGPAVAREWLYFAAKYDAQAALDAGFVTRLFAPDELHARARDLARSLCERDALALRLMKANCLSAEHLPIDAFIRVETERHLQTTDRPELAARMRAGYLRNRSN
ncbi:Enoyl-CoA hydratase [Novosphingobium sp. 9U]|nr:Enoyl-CoA hydratase [Novosphingobium sp. 9U]